MNFLDKGMNEAARVENAYGALRANQCFDSIGNGSPLVGAVGAASLAPHMSEAMTITKVENGFGLVRRVNFQEKVWVFDSIDSLFAGIREQYGMDKK